MASTSRGYKQLLNHHVVELPQTSTALYIDKLSIHEPASELWRKKIHCQTALTKHAI